MLFKDLKVGDKFQFISYKDLLYNGRYVYVKIKPFINCLQYLSTVNEGRLSLYFCACPDYTEVLVVNE